MHALALPVNINKSTAEVKAIIKITAGAGQRFVALAAQLSVGWYFLMASSSTRDSLA